MTSKTRCGALPLQVCVVFACVLRERERQTDRQINRVTAQTLKLNVENPLGSSCNWDDNVMSNSDHLSYNHSHTGASSYGGEYSETVQRLLANIQRAKAANESPIYMCGVGVGGWGKCGSVRV